MLRSISYKAIRAVRETASRAISPLRSSISWLFWLGVLVPVFGLLNFLYTHRPIADPGSVNYDIQIYFDAASGLLKGLVPYRDFFFQYPPFSLLFFAPPRLPATDLGSYFVWFNLELFVLTGIGLVATRLIALRVGQPVGQTMAVYCLGLLTLGAIIPQRYDLIPAIIVALALASWLSNRPDLAYGLLAIGTLVKIYPALLVPVLVITQWNSGERRAAARGLVVFSAILALGIIPFLLLSPTEITDVLLGQASRGVGLGSVYAAVMLAGRSIGVPAQVIYERNLNIWNVQIPDGALVSAITTIIQISALAFVYVRYFRSKARSSSLTVRYMAAVVAVAILTSKVLSPQYVIWLFPISFLTGRKHFIVSSVLFLGTALLSQVVYPFLWVDFRNGATLPIAIALVRDLLLASLCFVLLRAMTATSTIDSPTQSAVRPAAGGFNPIQ